MCLTGREVKDPESAGAERGEVLGRIGRGIGDVIDLARVLQVIWSENRSMPVTS